MAKLNLKKDELISVAVEMGLEIPSKAKIIDLKKLIESSAVYKNDIEFVRSLVENALEKKKAFQIKSVPDELKAEILLNILGERVNNLLTYARKLPSENYVQFASRLSATFDYYCQLRKVNEFRSLCDLIISYKIFETLARDTMNHIATKQGETYFKTQQLGRECDVYLSARGKVSNDLMSRNPGSGVKTDGRNRLQTVSTWRQERNSSSVFVAETKPNCVLCKDNNFHPLSKCYQFKKLSVEDRVGTPYNSLIHFSRDKTRNPTPTSNLNLDAPTFVPGQIEGSVEANSQLQFVVTGFEKGRLKNVFLSTVRALVKNKYSQWVEVRCLLDVGSQSCLCTRACAEKFQLKMEKINTVVSCVNDASIVVKNCVKTSVANKAKTFESELMLVVNKITDLIPNKVIDVDVNVSEFVPLADDKFNIPDRIDMLLGAEIFYELLKPGKFYCDSSHLVLQNTVFGYVPDGRGYELVSSVRALVPQKFSVEEELMHVKHVDVKSPHVGVMWKFGRGVISSGEVKEDMFETNSRFRRHKFAFSTDIQKMYRQILINPDQQDLQRIIWKHGLDAEIVTYRLKTVTYGLSNAPFLAIRTLQQLAKDEKSRFLLSS
ncbi:integrase catalytic domain-containing protein [Trichonephila clavipes]|uniref:Integrase catalytic domain-containing protein n=1 Tax=Trichonephila clavipes TaxID=2585209 RepID=A0A8X6SMD3_TRICX|nr:integrase catalytic domain-containing protein [Trichonephila clavipes]